MTSPSTPATTRLYLVRHGATQLTAEDRFSRTVGVELSDAGRRQALRLAERLAHDAIRAVYCSPLSRTLETAETLAKPHGLPLVRRDGLREIGHGRWEGLTRREVEERFGDDLQRHVALLESPAPAGAEPVQLVGRAASFSWARTVASPPVHPRESALTAYLASRRPSRLRSIVQGIEANRRVGVVVASGVPRIASTRIRRGRRKAVDGVRPCS